MATLAELAPQRGDIVTSVCAVRREGPAFPGGLPTLRGGIPFDTPGARLTVTVYQVNRNNGQGLDHLTVLASTKAKKTGERITIFSGFRNYLGERGERVNNDLTMAGVRITVRKVDDETRLVVSPNSKVDNPNGRRIYIHQDAFFSLAKQSPGLANLVFGSLMRVSAIKTAHHHLADAVDFGTITPDQGQNVLHLLEKDAKGHLTQMMQKIGYRSPDDKRDFFPLLEADEHIEASCFEDGYFTYATGEESGRIMFADKEKITEERLAVREGRGPKDLTIVTKNIAPIDSKIGTGLDVASNYFPSKNSANVCNDRVEEIKNSVRESVLDEVARIVIESISWDMTNEDQQTALRGLLAACVSSLKSGIFRDIAEQEDPEIKYSARREIAEQLIRKFTN